MTYLFTNIRLSAYLVLGALSAVVLGFAAYFASVFLPHIHHDYSIFAVIVPSLTILFLLIFLVFTHIFSPRFETIGLFILTILWLALAAWTVDRRDFLSPDSDCYSWGIQRVVTKKGTISAMSYCSEMKVIEAFSWVIFGTFLIAMIIIINLTSKAGRSRPYAWREPMLELGWYGEYPGYSGGQHSEYPTYRQGSINQSEMTQHGAMMQPGMMPQGMPMQQGMSQPMNGQYGPGGYVIQQNPGHSIVIQPGLNGEAPRITQVAGTVNAV